MFRSSISALALVVSSVAVTCAQGVFTVNIGGPGGGSGTVTPLVRHGDDWRYRFGTNAPQSDWKTTADASLDTTWLTGPGGFGYEDGDDATVLNVMSNRFSTLYIRREFVISNTLDTNQLLRLTMDWDDGFVAWLDGTEIARSSNAPGAVGTEPAFNAVSLAPNHEASAGGGDPPRAYNLGRAADRLAPGTHVLSVMGLNGATNSGDFSLIADLDVLDAGAAGGATTNQHITIVQSTPVLLSGSNTLAGATRVTVNGIEAALSIAEGTWRLSQPLNPGMNRLFIAALDNSGNILASAERDIVFEDSTLLAGGVITSNTSWTSTVVRVTNSVTIPTGVTLNIEAGAVLLLSGGVNITATGVVNVAGTELDPVFVFPAGAAAWGNFGANGTNASATFRYAETVGGQLRVANGGTLLVEDSVVRDLPETGREIIAGVNGGDLTIRRSRVARFSEVDARETPVLIEQCLLEQFLVDGVDIKATNSPLIVRESTLRYGSPTNSNADAVDFGPGAGTVERCLVHGFRDKGISIGGAPGTRVTGTVIYDCGIGISAYSSTGLVLANNTISACDNGILFRNNPQPAIGTGTNLIVWGNLNNLVLTNTSTLNLTFSDIEGGAPAGEGNISIDPQFINAAANDYRLAATSPARGAGLASSDMGAIFPVGGIPAAPAMLAAGPAGPGAVRLSWQEDADNEDGFMIERSFDGVTWSSGPGTSANATEFIDTGLDQGRTYFYRVFAVNSAGKSRHSNIASARAGSDPATETFVGGQLTESTTWSPNMGIVYVRSNVIVPTNMVLTIAEGTIVRITNGASIRAVAGGTINVLGTESNKVVISRWTPNVWGELSANGTNASLYVRHADISGGQTTVYNAAVGLLEDSYFHNYRITGTTLTQPIVLSQFARLMTMRRCHIQTYYETLFRNGVIIVEDCLFEDISGDAIDFDAAQTGTVLRRSTFRNGTLGNVDAVDVGNAELGGSRDVIIEDCLMYNFPFDKGVSVGDSGASTGTVVRNCLIYGSLSGIQAKDACVVTVYNCTIVNNSWGFTNYNKANPSATNGGGHTIAWNNILWDNRITISMWDNGTLTAWNNDLGNTNWPGEANLNVDPLFLNPAARDYRLSPNSPCIGAGSNGVTMGVTFPVGGLPAEPASLVVITNHGVQVLLAWNDASWNESGFIIEASTNASDWVIVAGVGRDATNAVVTTASGLHFRVKGTNFIGASFASNVATASPATGDSDSDGMPDAWEDTYGFDRNDPDDAGEDADTDGQTNLAEFLAGTDPKNAASRFGITSIVPVGADSVRLSFTVQAGKTYAIQFRDSLTSGNWQDLIDVPAEGTSRLYTFTDSLPSGTRTRFYRLIIP